MDQRLASKFALVIQPNAPNTTRTTQPQPRLKQLQANNMRLPQEGDWSPTDPVNAGISMSPEISEIATALNSALSDITDAPKTATAFKYKYAPLDEVMNIVRKACHKNGLFLLQSPWSPEQGALGVTTLLTHKSGQWIQTPVSYTHLTLPTKA